MKRILVRPLVQFGDARRAKEEWIDAFDMPDTDAERNRIRGLAEAAYIARTGFESPREHKLVRTGPVRTTDHGPWIVGMLRVTPVPPTVIAWVLVDQTSNECIVQLVPEEASASAPILPDCPGQET